MRVFTGKLPQVILWKNAVETMAFNCGKVMVLGVLVGPLRNDFTQRWASNYVFQNTPKKGLASNRNIAVP